MLVGLCFSSLHCGNGQTILLGACHKVLFMCERTGSLTVGVRECLCAHVKLCVLTKKLTSFYMPLQGRAGLLCSPYKQKIHELAALTCYPKAGSHL